MRLGVICVCDVPYMYWGLYEGDDVYEMSTYESFSVFFHDKMPFGVIFYLYLSFSYSTIFELGCVFAWVIHVCESCVCTGSSVHVYVTYMYRPGRARCVRTRICVSPCVLHTSLDETLYIDFPG